MRTRRSWFAGWHLQDSNVAALSLCIATKAVLPSSCKVSLGPASAISWYKQGCLGVMKTPATLQGSQPHHWGHKHGTQPSIRLVLCPEAEFGEAQNLLWTMLGANSWLWRCFLLPNSLLLIWPHALCSQPGSVGWHGPHTGSHLKQGAPLLLWPWHCWGLHYPAAGIPCPSPQTLVCWKRHVDKQSKLHIQ